MSKTKSNGTDVLGLCTDNGTPVPLKAITASVKVTGYVAEVSAKLTYYNEESTPINAVFTFPMDINSAVYMFEADIAGKHIVAEIQRRQQAQLTYQDAIDHGKTALMLNEDESAGDTFCCKLGNLPSKTEAMLTMKYVIELPQEPDGRIRFTLPTVLNPRYSPDVKGEVAASGATYVPPCKVPYQFNMTAKVSGYFRVKSVTSDSIQLRVDLLENQKIAEVSLDEEFKFDHDLSFLVEYESSFEPQIILEPGNPEADGMLKEDVLMISFHPNLKPVAMATSGEFIFLIDRSASMHGDRITNAKEALLLFLKSLPSNSYFNIVSFGSKFKNLFSSSKQYSEKNLKKAVELCEKMKADMKGTEIFKPLQQIFKQKLIQGHSKYLFVLTDGEVRNTNEVNALVKKYSQETGTRVFSVGIGAGASTALVNGMATNGSGKAEFINNDIRVQAKVVSLLKCAMQPAITEMNISWDLPPDVTPNMILEPPSMLSAGERLTLFVVLKGVDIDTVYAPSTVVVSGKQNDRKVSFSMNFTLSEDEEPNISAPVHRLATKRNLQLFQSKELELMLSDDYVNPDDIQCLRNDIMNLSCHGNVISKFTSFVAVDCDGKAVELEPVDRPCPVPSITQQYLDGILQSIMKCCSLDLGSDLLESTSEVSSSPQRSYHPPKPKQRGFLPPFGLFSKKSKSSSAPVPRSSLAVTTDQDEFGALETNENEISLDEDQSSHDDMNSLLTDSVTCTESGDQMLAVISLQQINGKWLLSDALLNALVISKSDFEKLNFSKDTAVVCTTVAVSWLRHRFPSREEEWQMIELKALAWLSSNVSSDFIEENIKLVATSLWKKK